MSAIAYLLMAFVAASGLATVAVADPARQALVAAVHGLLLAILFVVFRAPDVALSQLVIGTLAYPALVVLTLIKVGRDAAR